MPIPVIAYALQISTHVPPQPNAPPPPAFIGGVSIQLQQNGPFVPLPINGPDEFMAVAALLQTPGRLLFEQNGATLQKIQP